jgi:hypothetical protein
MLSSALLVSAAWLTVAADRFGVSHPCPAANYLPQLTIDILHDPPLPIVDEWQVLWGTVPLSDVQLTQLAGDDLLNDRTRAEINARGTLVYIGMMLTGAGAAAASAGWVLFGQDRIGVRYSLPVALGGLLLGVAGLLMVTETVQRPLEPLLAPTPVHRLTRDEARALVAKVNQQLYRQICNAATLADDPDAVRPMLDSPTVAP